MAMAEAPPSSTESVPLPQPAYPHSSTILTASDFFADLGSSALPRDEEDETSAPTPLASTSAPRPLRDAQGRALNPRSCVTCRKRKVKCDKVHPCNNCSRQHIECIFPSPGRAPRKPRKPGEGRDKDLLERLRRLEGVVKTLGVEVPTGDGGELIDNGVTPLEERTGSEAAAQGVPSLQMKPANGATVLSARESPESYTIESLNPVEDYGMTHFETRFGRLVINEGKSRYVNNSFWASLSNEVEDIKGILNESGDEDDGPSPNTDPMIGNEHQGWVFGFSSQSADLLSLHPLPTQIPKYWDTYKDRVDPLVKVLHIPTAEPTVLRAASHLSNLSKGFEALLFAIYYGAVTSLSSQECTAQLGEEKSVLLSRYRFGLEQALARANFLTTEEVVILQAIVVYLLCLRRNNDARAIWTLTGLVVRIAQTMGVHRDGSHFGLSPFEIEMRRRLWWQVCILDVRASEDHGCDPTITEQLFDTKLPLNVNDADLTPDMTAFPAEKQGCTDMTFCLIRFEVANTFRRLNYTPPGTGRGGTESPSVVTLEDKVRWISESHHRLEERYLSHCDMSVPLFWVTATVARLVMSKMWLMIYHPFQRQDGGASLPQDTKDKLFLTSLESIEYALLLETEARTMKWGWLFRTYMQWHALAFLLCELCHRTTGDEVERAWVAVEKVQDGRWGRHITGEDPRAGHLWRPLRKLCRKAKEAHIRGMQEERLAQQRATNPPTRTYSPNANPMFGHPNRPTMTRAPLSRAQVQRFTQGPLYGSVPSDPRELFKAFKFRRAGSDNGTPRTNGIAEPEGPQSAPAASTSPPLHNEQSRIVSNSGASSAFDPLNGSMLYHPSAQTSSSQGPTFNQPFPQSTNNINAMSPNTTAAYAAAMAPPRQQFPQQLNPLDPTLDLDATGAMDTSGDVEWDNWDQLVSQFSMDVDPIVASELGGFEATGSSSMGLAPDWTAPNWDGNSNGIGTNLRMGMGAGDWF